jgi:hypothetical protein
VVGLAAGHPLPGILHLWTAGLVLVFLALMATDWWRFPAPYDRRLWERQVRREELSRGRLTRKGGLTDAVEQCPDT